MMPPSRMRHSGRSGRLASLALLLSGLFIVEAAQGQVFTSPAPRAKPAQPQVRRQAPQSPPQPSMLRIALFPVMNNNNYSTFWSTRAPAGDRPSIELTY